MKNRMLRPRFMNTPNSRHNFAINKPNYKICV